MRTAPHRTATDTHDEAHRAQIEAHRSLSDAERFALVFEMSEFARELTRSGIRLRHPDWADELVEDELIRRLHGDELAAAVIASRRSS